MSSSSRHDTRYTEIEDFPFSLTGVAKCWYARYIGSVNGEWEKLQSRFYLAFFPLSCCSSSNGGPKLQAKKRRSL
jgi:hypothetical protein